LAVYSVEDGKFMKRITLLSTLVIVGFVASCSSSRPVASPNKQGQAVAIRQPVDEPTPAALSSSTPGAASSAPTGGHSDALVRGHDNKLLSQEKVQIDGKTFLVQRFIITEEPLETHVETTELPPQ
jgi:hypothetical protein